MAWGDVDMTGASAGDDEEADAWAAMFRRVAGDVDTPASVPGPASSTTATAANDADIENDHHVVDDDDDGGEEADDAQALEAWLKKSAEDRLLLGAFEEARDKVQALWELGNQLPQIAAGKRGPLVKVRGLLPDGVARAAYRRLAASTAWEAATARTDRGRGQDGAGSTQHRYDVGLGDKSSEALVSALTQQVQALLPGVEGAFQASRYSRGHFIEPHDDVAFKDIDGRRYVRDIAVLVYFTRGWTAEMGGAFVDLAAGEAHVPEFNSLVAFRVPRLHEVSRLTTDARRLALFGWFYRPCEAGAGTAKRKRKANQRKRKRKRLAKQQ